MKLGTAGMRMTFAVKLTMGFLLIILSFVGLNTYDKSQTEVVNKGYEDLVTRSAPLVFDVKDLNFELKNEGYMVRGYLLTNNPSYLQEYQVSRQKITQLFDNLDKNLITPEGKQKIAQTREAIHKYHESSDRTIAISQTQGLQAAMQNIEAAGAISEEAESKVNDFATFLTQRMDLRMEQSRQVSQRIAAQTAVAGTIFSLLALTLGIWFARRMARPLKELVAAANAVAAGDLTLRQIQYRSNDEIRELLDAFAVMTGNLKQLVTQVADASQQVAASSEQLTASAEQSAMAANQIATAISDVAVGADKQLGSVNQATEEVDQMSDGIHHIADSANVVTAASEKTVNAAKQGGQAIERAVSQMSTIQKTVAQSAQVVTALGARSQEIGQIVSTISGIAGQTNLLALNAAIEAARAGEQGRGFAVVAEEVRKLAEQSQEAAKQIAQLIATIQEDTDKAVAAMQQGTQEVDRGTEVVNSAGKTFSEIAELIRSTTAQTEEISAAIQQLASSSQRIVTTVKDIEAASKEASGQAQTVQAATEEQSASMEEIAASSQSLAKMAEELQNVLSKFKM